MSTFFQYVSSSTFRLIIKNENFQVLMPSPPLAFFHLPRLLVQKNWGPATSYGFCESDPLPVLVTDLIFPMSNNLWSWESFTSPLTNERHSSLNLEQSPSAWVYRRLYAELLFNQWKRKMTLPPPWCFYGIRTWKWGPSQDITLSLIWSFWPSTKHPMENSCNRINQWSAGWQSRKRITMETRRK